MSNDFYKNLAFARGYYDGRTKGYSDEDFDVMLDWEKEYYQCGFDAGVQDYCEIDESKEVA